MSLFQFCDYINFDKNNENYFIQPALGYVPFVDEITGFKSYVYAAINAGKKIGKLEFILNQSQPILSIYHKDNIVKKTIKKILNFLIYFKSKNDFLKLVTIDNAEVIFFVNLE